MVKSVVFFLPQPKYFCCLGSQVLFLSVHGSELTGLGVSDGEDDTPFPTGSLERYCKCPASFPLFQAEHCSHRELGFCPQVGQWQDTLIQACLFPWRGCVTLLGIISLPPWCCGPLHTRIWNLGSQNLLPDVPLDASISLTTKAPHAPALCGVHSAHHLMGLFCSGEPCHGCVGGGLAILYY